MADDAAAAAAPPPAEGDGVQDLTAMVQNLLQKMVGVALFFFFIFLRQRKKGCVSGNQQYDNETSGFLVSRQFVFVFGLEFCIPPTLVTRSKKGNAATLATGTRTRVLTNTSALLFVVIVFFFSFAFSSSSSFFFFSSSSFFFLVSCFLFFPIGRVQQDKFQTMSDQIVGRSEHHYS